MRRRNRNLVRYIEVGRGKYSAESTLSDMDRDITIGPESKNKINTISWADIKESHFNDKYRLDDLKEVVYRMIG